MMGVHARRPSAGLIRALPVIVVILGGMALCAENPGADAAASFGPPG